MGLAANISAVEASQTLVMAQAIAVALGDDPKLQAQIVHRSTGNDRLAQRIEIQAQMQRSMRG